MNILFLTNFPIQYRIDFFNKFGEMCDLTVVFEGRESKDFKFNCNLGTIRNFKYEFLCKNEINNIKAAWKIVRIIREKYKKHLIIIGSYSTLASITVIEYLRLNKRGFIVNSDGGFIKKDSILKKQIKKHLIGAAQAWLSSGRMTTEYLSYYNARKGSIYEYPFSSIQESDILEKILLPKEKEKIKKELKIKYEKIVLAIGQIIYRKGYDVLLKTAEYIGIENGIYIIGGNPTEKYKEYLRYKNIKNVHFIDFLNKDDLKKFFLIADIFVHPTREDIWGLVINEAMAYGLPVVTTNKCIAGMELIKNEKNGFIVPVEEEMELKNKILFLLHNEKICKNIAKNNLNKINQWTIENMAKTHIKIIRNIYNN